VKNHAKMQNDDEKSQRWEPRRREENLSTTLLKMGHHLWQDRVSCLAIEPYAQFPRSACAPRLRMPASASEERGMRTAPRVGHKKLLATLANMADTAKSDILGSFQ
jgi:hypothetical protein